MSEQNLIEQLKPDKVMKTATVTPTADGGFILRTESSRMKFTSMSVMLNFCKKHHIEAKFSQSQIDDTQPT